MYFVIGSDGQKYGPVDINGLKQWVTEGRVNATTVLEEQGSGNRIQAATIRDLGLGSSPDAPRPSFTPPGYGAPTGYSAPSAYPASKKPASSSAGTILGIILALLIIGGGIAAFFYFKSPWIVGTWSCDRTAEANQNLSRGSAGQRASSATATYTFKKDGTFTYHGEVHMINRTVVNDEKGTYTMDDKTVTATISESSVVINGAQSSASGARVGQHHTLERDGETLKIISITGNVSGVLNRQK